jgi:hypothetical protein
MSIRHTSNYKGYVITTRCSATAFERFESSFAVFPPVGADCLGQQFMRLPCRTSAAAMAEAYAAALTLVEEECRQNGIDRVTYDVSILLPATIDQARA